MFLISTLDNLGFSSFTLFIISFVKKEHFSYTKEASNPNINLRSSVSSGLYTSIFSGIKLL